MAKTPYENKSYFDPGRFRYSLTFFEQSVEESDSGGQSVTWSQLITTRAVREDYVRRLNEFGNLDIIADMSVMQEACYFIIRFRKDFAPAKDMAIVVGSDVYTIRSSPLLDTPPNYYKMLCVKTDLNLTT